MKNSLNIFWFRRDLRLNDNAGLYHALLSGLPVLPIFIFDPLILDRLENKKDARVEFIYDSIQNLHARIAREQSALEVYYGKPAAVFSSLAEKYQIRQVFTNEDYEPDARERDAEVEKFLKTKSISFHSFKDQVIFSKQEVLKDDGNPYTVYTPYSNKWKTILNENPGFYFKPYATEKYFSNLFRQAEIPLLPFNSIGFFSTGQKFPESKINADLIKKYG